MIDDIKRPSSYFNQDLWEVPNNKEEWISFVANLKSDLKVEINPEKKLLLIEHIGMAERVLLNFREAEPYLLMALSISFEYTHNRYVQNLIRLAQLYQWTKEFAKSHLLYDQAKALIAEKAVSDTLLASYHQHLAKLYFDQCYYEKAQSEFTIALNIREKIAAPYDQIESSRNSLNEAIKRAKNISIVKT